MKTTSREEFARLGDTAASALALDGIVVPPAVLAAETDALVARETANPGAFAAEVDKIAAEFDATLAQ